jgi:hypothetical protein
MNSDPHPASGSGPGAPSMTLSSVMSDIKDKFKSEDELLGKQSSNRTLGTSGDLFHS